MTWKVTELVSGGYLVEGTDTQKNSGTTVLHSQGWTAAKGLLKQHTAEQEFDKVVEKFFAPLTKAADALVSSTEDPAASVVIGTEVSGEESIRIELDESGIVLNLIEQGNTDRLRWVGDKLVVLAA